MSDTIKYKTMDELNTYQESLLKKRRRDDVDRQQRIDIRAKAKLAAGRKKKEDEKVITGKNILMPEVFVSNHMKQQRNYVHYKRNKNKMERGEKAAKMFNSEAIDVISRPTHQVKHNSLVLVIRIKGLNQGTTPQAQKILSDLGLR